MAGMALLAGGIAAGADAPVNRWVLHPARAPNIVWETGIAYDPDTHLIVRHGGHILGSSAQDNYTKFRKLWTRLNDNPVTGREFRVAAPADGPPHRYFYVRAVNVLGQEGFHTDIVSVTDSRFRP